MSESQPPSRLQQPHFAGAGAPPLKRGFFIPSWFLSLLLHGGLLFVFAATLSARRGGIVGDAAGDFRRVGIYVGHSGDGGPGEGSGTNHSDAPNVPPAAKIESVQPNPEPTASLKTAELPLPTTTEPPAEPAKITPVVESKPRPVIGPGEAEPLFAHRNEQQPTPGPASTNSHVPASHAERSATPGHSTVHATAGRSRSGGGPRGSFGTAPFFGIWDAGGKFIYVIDCSGSMFSYNAMQSAKNELLSSLQSLRRSQLFQIVFYNIDPKWMKAPGKADFQYFPATESNRRLASQFIAGVQPDGGTQHLPALSLALRLHPDVIFFLTDAGEPGMKPEELAEVQRLNAGRTRIHCVQFGQQDDARDPTSASFLRKLAAQNNGDYAYENIKRFAEAQRPLPQLRASAPAAVSKPTRHED